MKRLFTLVLGVLALSATAQEPDNIKYCGTYEAIDQFLEENPSLKEAYLQEQMMMKNAGSQPEAAAGVVYTIPVVIHIVHNYGVENVSDAQVYDAIRILNEDFRKLNSDTSNIVSSFKGIAADSEIQFRLAQLDPNGNCTNGIDRIVSTATYSADESTKLNPWPRSKYLNIWVVNTIASGAAGYTFLPSNWTSPSKDGIIIRYDYFGSIGTGSVGRSRALTHEIGHWLNLPHTWGGTNNPGLTSNCGDDDGVSDTPNTIGWTSCNLTGTSCSSLDNVQNYMEYSYCSNMFTQGQATKMRTALTSSTAQRNSLWTTSNLSATGTNGNDILCDAEFSANRTQVCQGDVVSFTDESFNGQSTWSWTFTGGSPASSSSQNPTVTYNTPGTYPVTLTVGNGSQTKTETKTSYITVYGNPGHPNPVMEGFESGQIDPNFWVVNNPDGSSTWQLASTGATGSHSAYINNTGSLSARKDELVSRNYAMNNLSAVTMTFKVAYAKRTASDLEYLRVYVSGNCGQTWALRYGKSGTNLTTAANTNGNFVPAATEWRTETITNISAGYLTDEFMFKFEFESDGGNNIYIDDINIGQNTGISENEPAYFFSVFPNPVESGSSVSLGMKESTDGTIMLIDVTGRHVSNIFTGTIPAGDSSYEVPAGLSAGVYYVVLQANGMNMTRKIVVN